LAITKYCRRAGLDAQTFNTELKMNRITKFQITTATCLLAILCYGLSFNANALGGLVKPTSIIMAKSQKGGSQPPKKKNTMYEFGSVHTGSNANNPGVLKAQADKAKRDSVAAEYKKKADAKKAAAIKKAQGKK
jgi:hypothetical protein